MLIIRLFFIFFLASTALSAQTFFGTTRSGGTNGGGTIFRVNADGSGLSTEYDFRITSNAGRNADFCQMTKLANGKLYGVTPYGGQTDTGVLFEYDPSNNTYTKKIDFDSREKGLNPFGRLALAANGKLYGITSNGGQNSKGVIFEYDVATNTLTKKGDFDGTKGAVSLGGLSLASNGKFYGMTYYGGLNDKGVLFEYDPSNNTFTKKIDFDGEEKGANPLRDLTLAANNKFYGTTTFGGANGSGVLFEFDPATGNFTKKIDFNNSTTGGVPIGSLVLGANNKLYGTTALGGANDVGVLFEFDPSNNAFTKKIDFDGTLKGNGGTNVMVKMANGKLYGTTELGGVLGGGVLFEFDPATGVFTKKLDFGGTDGHAAKSGLTLADNNKLYGTTAFGGQFESGVIFEFDPATNIFTKKIDFNGATNGSYPENSLVLSKNGKLYGVTPDGGPNGWGILFEYDPLAKRFENKINFDDALIKGANHLGKLAMAENGKLYGVSVTGGINNEGILFEYDPSNDAYTKKVDFEATSKGRHPKGGLTLAANNKFYGMSEGGGNNGHGVIYEYNPATGIFTKKIDLTVADGAAPAGNLTLAGNGKLYGVMRSGGANDTGVIFEYDPATNSYVKRVDFDGATNGANPVGSLVLASNGKLYGMTPQGGLNDTGVIFEFDISTNICTKKIDFNNNDGIPLGSFVNGADGKLIGHNINGGPQNFGSVFQYDPATNTYTVKSNFLGANGATPGKGSLVSVVLPPVITDFTPIRGVVGASVTITGHNFSATPANNIVYFGATKASVESASFTELVVTVPIGATYSPISVSVNGLIAHSRKSFIPTINTAGNVNINFAGKVDLSLGAQTKRGTVGDLDADGKPDIAVAQEGANVVSIFRNVSSFGSITSSSFEAKIDLSTGTMPYSVALGDLDGDGKLDMVVANMGVNNSISVFRNNSATGSISFASKINVGANSGLDPSFVTIHDIDGDGKSDILVANATGGAISVFRNVGSVGSITPESFATKVDFNIGGSLWGIDVGDIDGDGKVDLAVPSMSGYVSVLRNTSTAGIINSSSFAAKVDYSIGTEIDPSGIFLADLDGDGKKDMIVGGGNAGNSALSIFRNVTTAGIINSSSFETRIDIVTPTPWSVTVGDIDGDGKPDIAATNISEGTITIFKNNCSPGTITSGSFSSKTTVATSGQPLNISIVDIDGDGLSDLAIANETTNAVNVFRNAGDTSLPIVTDNTPATVNLGSALTIAAQIVDNETIVNNASVEYRSVSKGGNASIVSMSATQSNYSVTISASDIGELGIEYRIKAVSGGGTYTSSWKGVRVNVINNGLPIPYSSFGSSESNYRIISVPLNLTANTVNNVFADDLGAYDKARWRMYRYDNGQTSEVSPSSTQISPGFGYWLIVKDNPGKEITSGPGTTVTTNSETPFEIDLKADWNQIGNPFNFNLSWADIQAANPGLPGLRKYNGDFVDGSVLNKMEGGFVKVAAAQKLKFPAVKNASVNSGRKSDDKLPFQNSLDQPNWQVYFTLRQGDLFNRISGFGMNKKASDGFDVYDGFTMPRFFSNFLELNHSKKEGSDFYSSDVVAVAENHIWDFSIDASADERIVDISWDNSYFGDNEKELFLWDIELQRSVNMRTASLYQFDKNVSRSFKVIFGSSDFVRKEIAVNELIVHHISPNPATSHVTFSFSLPEIKNNQPVNITMVDLLGRKVREYHLQMPTGYNEVIWIREKEASGVYLVTIRAAGGVKQARLVLR